MARNPESVLTDRIKRDIHRHAEKHGATCLILKIGGGAFNRSGIPDLLVLWEQCVQNEPKRYDIYPTIPIFMEVKAGSNGPSKLQTRTIDTLVKMNVTAGVVRSSHDAITLIDEARGRG